MAFSETFLFKNLAVHWTADRICQIPHMTRGIYVLFRKEKDWMNVVYIGVSRGPEGQE
jgi:hypothetical protein